MEASIKTAHIANANITTAKIEDLAVTNAKIANATIQSAKIHSIDTDVITVGDAAGKTRISGDTIEVKDASAKTRAVMGDMYKDGQQYGFVSYAADGVTEMFNSTGITAAGIPDRTVVYAALDQTTANATITVGAGMDYATIQAAINTLPHFINHSIIIEVYNGTYDEDVMVSNFQGPGYIKINGHTGETINIKSITISDNSQECAIWLNNLTITDTADTAVYVSNSYILFGYLTITAIAATKIGIRLDHSTGSLDNCVISNRSYGITARYNSEITLNTMSGTGNVTGIEASASIVHDMGGTTLTGTISRSAGAGGVITPSGGLDFSAKYEQDDWGYIQGAAANYVTESVTFPVAYDAGTYPIVKISSAGIKNTGAPSNLGDTNSNAAVLIETRVITNTGFDVYIFNRDAATNLNASWYYLYTWSAKGSMTS
jgi:hypothetical protein